MDAVQTLGWLSAPARAHTHTFLPFTFYLHSTVQMFASHGLHPGRVTTLWLSQPGHFTLTHTPRTQITSWEIWHAGQTVKDVQVIFVYTSEQHYKSRLGCCFNKVQLKWLSQVSQSGNMGKSECIRHNKYHKTLHTTTDVCIYYFFSFMCLFKVVFIHSIFCV